MTPLRKSSPWRRSADGMTLIEVVAGIGLMGTVLVTTLAAHSAHVRQRLHAERKLAAVSALDLLISTRIEKGNWLESGEEGVLTTSPPIRWKTAIVPNSGSEALDCEVLRVSALTNVAGRSVEVAHVNLIVPGESER